MRAENIVSCKVHSRLLKGLSIKRPLISSGASILFETQTVSSEVLSVHSLRRAALSLLVEG
jgi:hypothetical protein